jgi:hypothetical protein
MWWHGRAHEVGVADGGGQLAAERVVDGLVRGVGLERAPTR